MLGLWLAHHRNRLYDTAISGIKKTLPYIKQERTSGQKRTSTRLPNKRTRKTRAVTWQLTSRQDRVQFFLTQLAKVLWIRIRMFLDLPDPDLSLFVRIWIWITVVFVPFRVRSGCAGGDGSGLWRCSRSRCRDTRSSGAGTAGAPEHQRMYQVPVLGANLRIQHFKIWS
jgi:hypothetical protein